MKAYQFQRAINDLIREENYNCRIYLHFGNAYGQEIVWTKKPSVYADNHDLYIEHKEALPYVPMYHYNGFSHIEWESHVPLYEGYCGGNKQINRAIDKAYSSGTAPNERSPKGVWEWLKPFIDEELNPSMTGK